MAFFEEATSPSTSNFDTTTGQSNSFFMPEIYAKKVQNFFRKASVVEAITNTDYTGEIASYGATVNIIKEPVITTYDYLRKTDTTQTKLTDQELVLIVDQARAFKFIVDDIEKKMSHVNWIEVASGSAAYALKDQMDSNVLTYISDQASTSSPDMVIGADDATADDLPNLNSAESVHLGFSAGNTDPLDLLSRIARLLDDQNVPEEDRWFVATPLFYEILSESSSKLLSVDYNAGQGSIRNGLVTSGLLRGFRMYKSNNTPAGSNAKICLAGHISAVATAGTLLKTESFRDPTSFGDVVRGLHVYGRKLLRDDAVVKTFWNIVSDA